MQHHITDSLLTSNILIHFICVYFIYNGVEHLSHVFEKCYMSIFLSFKKSLSSSTWKQARLLKISSMHCCFSTGPLHIRLLENACLCQHQATIGVGEFAAKSEVTRPVLCLLGNHIIGKWIWYGLYDSIKCILNLIARPVFLGGLLPMLSLALICSQPFLKTRLSSIHILMQRCYFLFISSFSFVLFWYSVYLYCFVCRYDTPRDSSYSSLRSAILQKLYWLTHTVLSRSQQK